MRQRQYVLLSLAGASALGSLLVCVLGRPGALAVVLCLLALVLSCGAWLSEYRWRLQVQQEAQQQLQHCRQEQQEQLALLRRQNHKELERFRSDLAHGLRIPIAIVQGYAELLVEGKVPSPETQKDYLEKILQRTQYMSTLLVKQFSVIDVADSACVSFSEVDLIGLIRQIVDDMQSIARTQDVQIQVLSVQPTLTVQADEYQLNRIFFNLLENAIKYMGRSGVVTIRASQQGADACVTVKDDGLGLSPEETAYIFEQDYRGSNRTGSAGSGHGLYLVRRIVQLHGGTVCAESALGQGMAIHLTLPLEQCVPVGV